MFTGKVIGKVWCTRKDESLEGGKLLIVQACTHKGVLQGAPFVAIDTVQAGEGDLVYLVKGREASIPWMNQFSPLDAAIVGIVDAVDSSRADDLGRPLPVI